MKQNKTQIAQELGVSRTRLYKMLAEGVVVPDASGHIDIAEARKSMATKLSAIHGGRRTSSTLPETFSDARQRKESALADLRELEAEEKKGTLINAESLLFDLKDCHMHIRSRLLSMPSKLARELAATSDEILVAAILKREVFEALYELSRFQIAGKEVAE